MFISYNIINLFNKMKMLKSLGKKAEDGQTKGQEDSPKKKSKAQRGTYLSLF